MPRKRKEVVAHHDLHQTGQDHEREFSINAQGHVEVAPPIVELVPGPALGSHAEALAFANELVEVMLNESNNPHDNHAEDVYLDGRRTTFVRGQPIVVRRCVAELLLRSKVTTYGNKKFVNEEGFEEYKHPPKTSLRYPFTLIKDANTKKGGIAWMQKIMAEA